MQGHGGPKDYAVARRLFALAVAQGYAESQLALGKMHFEGKGGPTNVDEARRLLELAAAQGHAGVP
jgi:TPR repeat protein